VLDDVQVIFVKTDKTRRQTKKKKHSRITDAVL